MLKTYIYKMLSSLQLDAEFPSTSTMADFRDITDPTYVGPGGWNVIHIAAWNSRTKEQKNTFIVLINMICNEFPCTKCRSHCQEYIKNHPIEDYLDVTVEISGEKLSLGPFIWSWKFHNSVNARLRKPIMNWNTAYNLYSGPGNLVCSINCLSSDEGS